MDDDVVVEPAWLQKLTAPFESGDWTGVGGRIVPDQDSTRLGGFPYTNAMPMFLGEDNL